MVFKSLGLLLGGVLVAGQLVAGILLYTQVRALQATFAQVQEQVTEVRGEAARIAQAARGLRDEAQQSVTAAREDMRRITAEALERLRTSSIGLLQRRGEP